MAKNRASVSDIREAAPKTVTRANSGRGRDRARG